MAIYAAAAHHDIFELAQRASSHLLAFPLDRIDDHIAALMGPVYLKRLISLHLNRLEIAKSALMQSPGFHPASNECSFEDQKRVKRAWALGATYLAWEIRADLSSQTVKGAFDPLIAELECAQCQELLQKRIRDILVAWSAVKCTI